MPNNKSSFKITISGKEIEANRPEPITSDIDVVPYKRRTDPQIAVDDLMAGYNVIILDYFSSGLSILSVLKKQLNAEYSNQSFEGQRALRSKFREVSHRLLLFVNNHKLTVRKAPEIGWFKILYPDLDEFLLPFPQVQGLNSSWQWYIKGLSMPVLDFKLHPFFETYFPTRYEHLELFENWLKDYKGEKESALDIGTGCGVLLFQMLKHGFEKVYGTDSNPNAIIGLNDELIKNNLSAKMQLFHGDLFAGTDIKSELIVFNPPWLPAPYQTDGLDNAVYYDSELFPRFFSEAEKRLKADGKIVLLFSNLAKLTNAEINHPIEEELKTGGRFRKKLFIQKKVKAASGKTRRNLERRSSEMVELWVLELNNTN